MENIVFDLGGVLFARDRSKCTQEFHDFFSFIRSEPMPAFWEDYDRGVSTLDEVRHPFRDQCLPAREMRGVPASVDRHAGTREAHRAACPRPEGRRLQVVCAFEHVARVHRLPARFPVYGLFDGEVVSCEEGVVKPEPEIYRRLLGRYGLDPAQTLCIDDRPANIAAAAALGIRGQLFDHSAPAATCDLLRRRLLPRK